MEIYKYLWSVTNINRENIQIFLKVIWDTFLDILFYIKNIFKRSFTFNDHNCFMVIFKIMLDIVSAATEQTLKISPNLKGKNFRYSYEKQLMQYSFNIEQKRSWSIKNPSLLVT